MDSTQRQLKRNSWASLLTMMMTLILVLLTLTSSSPVHHEESPPSDVTSEEGESWLVTSEGAARSHLVMWMMTEKQLLPRVQALVQAANALLRCTCGEEGKPGVEECLALGSSLSSITGLSDVPSQRVLRSENKRTFVKTLLENAYTSLKEVGVLLSSDVTLEGLGRCGGSHTAQHFMDSLRTASTQFENVMTFFKSRASEPGELDVPREEFSSERLLAIKLLYTAVHHLNKISSALEYSVEFSWFSRMIPHSSFNKGKRFNGSKRKNRKFLVRQ
ncbi:uncharacterized protein LOC143294346 [Babylonia areolata]|uniref:uncharacterized protein LOC143294346 n=1 Tax=Babylonia areolata TaxID=304850 RepID=UPI003FD34493